MPTHWNSWGLIEGRHKNFEDPMLGNNDTNKLRVSNSAYSKRHIDAQEYRLEKYIQNASWNAYLMKTIFQCQQLLHSVKCE